MRRFNRTTRFAAPAFLFAALIPGIAFGQTNPIAGEKPTKAVLQLTDVFKFEYASEPQVSPDGKQVVYVRNFLDIMKDRQRSHLWIINVDGREHRPLTSGDYNESSPRWSPDGKRLLYTCDASGSPQLYCRWMDTGQTAQLTRVPSSPSGPSWSPDGKMIAFRMFVEDRDAPFVSLPGKPEGAEWAKPPQVIAKLMYRFDGKGYLKPGYFHLFVVPAEGGEPRQLTHGSYDHLVPGDIEQSPMGPSWSPDGRSLYICANRRPDADYEFWNTEVYEVSVADGAVKALTDRKGPDDMPMVSPDGRLIAYSGYDDKSVAYQEPRLYVMNRDGSGKRILDEKLGRGVEDRVWNRGATGIFFDYSDAGAKKIGFIDLDGKTRVVAEGLGGAEWDRPYASGSFSVGGDDVIAYTVADTGRPADIAVVTPQDNKPRRITQLNDTWLADRTLGSVEEIWYESSYDKRRIQGWIIKPPDFDQNKRYPLILEIHGGPYADYGPYFAAELQLYAAAGYVVLYTNPRGSTGYGEAFAQLINNDYPGNDYDDLMSGVDVLVSRGYIDPNNLFVTGGSGGGILTAWIVGKTNRFRAAVAAKPVINQASFALTTDVSVFWTRRFFARPPWELTEEYLKRSPLFLVGNVTTPTMLLVGEADYRTPISEAEQFYEALKLRKVDTALVRIPDASHSITDRPSRLMAKVAYILRWFETHRSAPAAAKSNESN